MKHLKVLIASDGYRVDINGVARITAIHADEMRRRGLEVKVLTLSDRKISYKKGDDYYIRSYRSFLFPEWKKSHVRKHAYIDEIIKWRPDIIHIHTEGVTCIMAYMIAEACNTPIIMTSHTDYTKYVFGIFNKCFPITLISAVWGYFVYRRAAFVILPSKKALTFDQHRFIKDRAVILSNGIHLQDFRKVYTPGERRELMNKYGLSDNNKILLIVSRLGREKKISDILEWMLMLLADDPGIQLVIVGDGPYRKKLEKEAVELNIDSSVKFIGRISPEQIYRYYDIGTIFVSASDFEVNSLACLEAMACGLPLVCRNDECLEGVLEAGKNGYIFEAGEEFCRYVSELLLNEELRLKMGDNSRKRADDFDDRGFVDRMLEIYDRVITGHERIIYNE
jgi:1,2-diacylglycerol 3-alpha-glucosyltransferase